MKKPLHWFAPALWVGAGVIFAVDMLRLIFLPMASGMGPAFYWIGFEAAAVRGLELAALGLLIEIADQILWRGLTPEEQARRIAKPSALSIARKWPDRPDRS